MATVKQFLMHPYAVEWAAKILDVSGDCVILDETIFAPEAGGQSCDLGHMRTACGSTDIPVCHVKEKNGLIYHKMEQLPQDFVPGTQVLLSLDWNRRFDHMQNHCAEHILSGILFTRFRIPNKGFHLGSSFSTLDADIRQAPPSLIDELEEEANSVVFQKLPVEIQLIGSKEEAETFPLRKELKAQEDISIVTIPGVDCVACCCPHPSTTAEVGLIKILRAENYKGMTRIYFISGRRALEDYRTKHKILTALNQKYSSDETTLLENIKIQESKTEQIKRELYAMKETFAGLEADRLIALAEENASTGKSGIAPIFGQYDRLSLEDLKRIAKKIMEKSDAPVILSTDRNYTVLLTHSGKSALKCGQLVKDFACGFGGKGGGSDTQAQALFTGEDIMKNFIDIVRAQLRTF